MQYANRFLTAKVERVELLSLSQAKALVDGAVNGVGLGSGLTNTEHDNLIKLSDALEDLERMVAGQPPLHREHGHAEELHLSIQGQQQKQQEEEVFVENRLANGARQQASPLARETAGADKRPTAKEAQQQQQQGEQQLDSHSKKKKRKLEIAAQPVEPDPPAAQNGTTPVSPSQRKKARKDGSITDKHAPEPPSDTPQQYTPGQHMHGQQQQPDEHTEDMQHDTSGKEGKGAESGKKKKKKEIQEQEALGYSEKKREQSEKKKKKKRDREEGSASNAGGEDSGLKSHKKQKKHARQDGEGH